MDRGRAVLRRRAQPGGRRPRAPRPAAPGLRHHDRDRRRLRRRSPGCSTRSSRRSSTRARSSPMTCPATSRTPRTARARSASSSSEYDLEDWVDDNQDTLQDFAANLGTPALGVLRTFFTGLAAALTIIVLTVLMLLQGPRHRRRLRRCCRSATAPGSLAVGRDCAPGRRRLHRRQPRSSASSPACRRGSCCRSSASPTPACSACGWPSPTSSRSSAPRSVPSRRSGFAFLHSVPAGVHHADLLHRLPAVREPRAAGRR